MSPQYWSSACAELSSRDPILKGLIRKYEGETLRTRGAAFETLLRSIVGQQISVKAAQSVWDRLRASVAVGDPQAVLGASTETLRVAGLSGRKVEYVRDLAAHFASQKVDPSRWPKLNDEEIIAELVDIRGIGRWTAEMFLIFHLLRPNIFPKLDLGLQKAISIHYRKRYPMSERQLELFRKAYAPWATVATWYLWRSLDPIPVEY